MSAIAPNPTATFRSTVASCIPTLKERTALDDAQPASAKTSTACCVPAPPGVNGIVVARPPTTSTARTVSNVAGMLKASRKK